jgi:hypothetical protein
MPTENLAAIDIDAIQWEEYVSEHGKKYEVGHLRDEIPPGQDQAAMGVLGKSAFGIAADWPVGDSSWKYTDPSFRSVTAITRYALYAYEGAYKYILYFSNTEHYDYFFHDQTGDSYEVNTYRSGDHFVAYDSDKPTIAYISGR